MTETLEYIENYFKNALDDTGKKAFETRCETDEAFAQEVAFYTMTRQALREELLKEKQARWKNLKAADAAKEAAPTAKVIAFNLKKFIPYAAAASILIAVALVYLNGSNSPQQLANKYIKDNIEHIGIVMSASKDSLDKGIELYNDKKYDAALNLFKALDNNLPVSNDAKKYEGFVYLVTQNYDKALTRFDEIANMKLESNPGNFLKAITLLRRDGKGDREAAKALLGKVANEGLEGSESAKEILDKFKN